MSKFFRFPFGRSGDKTTVPDAVQPGGSVSYDQGYGPLYQLPYTDPQALNVERDKQNQLFSDITGAIQVLQVHGVPDWITSADNGGAPYPYDKGAIVRYTDGKTYMSRVTANTALPTVVGNWLVQGEDSLTFAGGQWTHILPSGVIEKWGELVLPNSGATTSQLNVVFTQPFPNENFGVTLTPMDGLNTTTGIVPVMQTPALSIAGFTAVGDANLVASFNKTVRVKWFAKGR